MISRTQYLTLIGIESWREKSGREKSWSDNRIDSRNTSETQDERIPKTENCYNSLKNKGKFNNEATDERQLDENNPCSISNVGEAQVQASSGVYLEINEQRDKLATKHTFERQGDCWEKLEDDVASCTLCSLHKTRKNTVFGVGNKRSSVLFIGEAPGATEDEQGKPFVGRAGQLLDAMLKAIGMAREQVFIANILKCRPPNNRDPEPLEVNCCTPYLHRQMALIEPKLIVALGRISAHFLLGANSSLGSLREKIHTYGESKIPLLVTFHPAYLLRSPREKAKAYQDFLHIKQLLA